MREEVIYCIVVGEAYRCLLSLCCRYLIASYLRFFPREIGSVGLDRVVYSYDVTVNEKRTVFIRK